MRVYRVLLEMVDEEHNKFYEGWAIDDLSIQPRRGIHFVAWGPRSFPRTGSYQELSGSAVLGRIKQKVDKGYKVVESWRAFEIPDHELAGVDVTPSVLRPEIEKRGAKRPSVVFDQEWIFDFDAVVDAEVVE